MEILREEENVGMKEKQGSGLYYHDHVIPQIRCLLDNIESFSCTLSTFFSEWHTNSVPKEPGAGMGVNQRRFASSIVFSMSAS